MAALPPLTEAQLAPSGAEIEHMTAVRSHAEGTGQLGNVYLTLLHNPALAVQVGKLGETIRFHGVLPDDVRELVILRFAARRGYRYEIAHHYRAATLAGLSDETIRALLRLEMPPNLRSDQVAAIRATDAVGADQSIPADVQSTLAEEHGDAGVVELVVCCGLYSIMGITTVALDVPIEDYLGPVVDHLGGDDRELGQPDSSE